MNQYDRKTIQFFLVRARNWLRRMAKDERDGASDESVRWSDAMKAEP